MHSGQRGRKRRQAFQRNLAARPDQIVQGRELSRAPFRCEERATARLKKKRGVIVEWHQLHLMAGQELLHGLPHAPGAAHAAGEQHAPGRESGLEQHQDVFAHGVEQSREDAPAILALVGEVGHVALENHGAAARERRGAFDRGGLLAGFLNGKGKPLDQLAEEVASALRTTVVFAKDLEAVGAQFEYGETVAPDGDDGGGFGAGQETAGAGLDLLDGHAGQTDLPAEAAAHRGRRERVPIPRAQQLEQRRPGFLVVLDDLAPAPLAAGAVLDELGELDGFGADIDAEVAPRAGAMDRRVGR